MWTHQIKHHLGNAWVALLVFELPDVLLLVLSFSDKALESEPALDDIVSVFLVVFMRLCPIGIDVDRVSQPT